MLWLKLPLQKRQQKKKTLNSWIFFSFLLWDKLAPNSRQSSCLKCSKCWDYRCEPPCSALFCSVVLASRAVCYPPSCILNTHYIRGRHPFYVACQTFNFHLHFWMPSSVSLADTQRQWTGIFWLRISFRRSAHIRVGMRGFQSWWKHHHQHCY